MAHKKRVCIVFSVLFAFAAAVDAAESPTVLTWAECVRLTARQNPSLLAADQAVRAGQARRSGSFNGLLPALTLSNSYQDGRDTQESWRLYGTASLDVLNAGSWASLQQASADLEASRAGRETASTETLLALYRAFTAVLFAQEQTGVARSIQETWKTNAAMIALRYSSGTESKGNHMKTQAQFQQAEADVLQAERDLTVARQELNQAMGMDRFTAFVATGTWTPSVPVPPETEMERLVAAQPRIRARQAALLQAQAAIRRAQSSLWPTLSANYSRGTRGPTEIPQNPFWSFSGLVSLPLFGSGPTATYYAVQAAQGAYEQARQELRAMRLQIRTELAAAWSAFAQAEDQARVQGSFLEAARQRKSESDIRYRSGLMSFENWSIVVNEFVSSQRNFLQAQKNLRLAEAQWHYAAGRPLTETPS